MITENTLLILGAGASSSYGYPTGAELRRQVFQNAPEMLRESKMLFDTLSLNEWLKKMAKFAREFELSSDRMIDYFLATREEFKDVGKVAILNAILKAEKNSRLRELCQDPDDDWMFTIYNSMIDGMNYADKYDSFVNNKVSIITFNYDRSLEYFLWESLINKFGIAPVEAQKLVDGIEIYHVFGRLPLFGHEENSENLDIFGYKGFGDLHLKPKYANCIKTLHERSEVANNKIYNSILNANRIFFLGFGFAKENMELLNIRSAIKDSEKRIYATAFGYSDSNIEKLKLLLTREIRRDTPNKRDSNAEKRVVIKDCKSKVLLEDYL